MAHTELVPQMRERCSSARKGDRFAAHLDYSISELSYAGKLAKQFTPLAPKARF